MEISIHIRTEMEVVIEVAVEIDRHQYQMNHIVISQTQQETEVGILTIHATDHRDQYHKEK